MKIFILLAASLMAIRVVSWPEVDDSCHYMKSRTGLLGYDAGGPYKLDPLKITKGRTDLRAFLWSHWHDHVKGIAEAKVGTIDAGVVTAIYVVQLDAKGNWGIDVELYHPLQPPPCSAFHADSLVRSPVREPDKGHPWQTSSTIRPDGKLPETLLGDSEVKDPKNYEVILLGHGKSIGSSI